MRRLLLALVLAACSSRVDRTGDPAVGRWTSEYHHTFELRADGTLDIDPITDTDCADSPALAACRARQRWERTGDIVTLERGALARPFSQSSFDGPRACECRLERHEVTLRGDELVVGKEHAARVK